MRVKYPLSLELGFDGKKRERVLSSLGMGSGTRTLLRKLGVLIKPDLDGLVAGWFDAQSAEPGAKKLLEYARKRGHLAKGMKGQLAGMFSGRFGEAYFEERFKVGFIHERVGVEPSWYMGAWRNLADLVRARLEAKNVPPALGIELLGAMERAVQLDQMLALEAYFHVRTKAVRKALNEVEAMARELEKKNARLVTQYAKVREASRIKEEFLSRVSHELRTPLNSIIGYSDLLLDGIDGPLNGEQDVSVRKMRRSGEILLALIEGMISASRLAAAGIISSMPFRMEEAARPAVEKYAAQAREKGLSFEIDLPSEALPKVKGDEEAFVTALAQVLDNAVKFTDSGWIRIVYEGDDDGVSVFVSDTGPGVPTEERKRIFEAFHQIDGGDDRIHSGLGMGLTMAFRAMKAMGGVLDLKPASSEGSTFRLWLPARKGGEAEPEAGVK